MDGATRLGSSFLALNAQFVHEDKVVIKTLAVLDSAGKHTAADTAAMVRTVMSKYELRKEQVLGIVTDNASSMIKCVEILNEPEVESQAEETDLIDASQEMDEDAENEAMASEFGDASSAMRGPFTPVGGPRWSEGTSQLYQYHLESSCNSKETPCSQYDSFTEAKECPFSNY